MLKVHDTTVRDWFERHLSQWRSQTVGNKLLQDCKKLDETILGVAHLSFLELRRRSFDWQLRDIQAQMQMIRTITDCIRTFESVWNDERDGEWRSIAALAPKRAFDRRWLETALASVAAEVQEVKSRYSHTMLSLWEAQDIPTADLQDFIYKLLEDAARLTDDGFVEAYNRKIERANLRMRQQQEKAKQSAAVARAKRQARADDRLATTAWTSKKRSDTQVMWPKFLLDIAIRDVVPLTNREATAADFTVDWKTIPFSHIKTTSSRRRFHREFKGTYTRQRNTFADIHSRKFRRNYAENQFFKARKAQAAERAETLRVRRAQEQRSMKEARAQLETQLTSDQARQLTEQTWNTQLPAPVRFDEIAPWTGLPSLDLSVDYWLKLAANSIQMWRERSRELQKESERFRRAPPSLARDGEMPPSPHMTVGLIPTPQQDVLLLTSDMFDAISRVEPVRHSVNLGRCDSLPCLHTTSMDSRPILWNPYPDSESEDGDEEDETTASEASHDDIEMVPR